MQQQFTKVALVLWESKRTGQCKIFSRQRFSAGYYYYKVAGKLWSIRNGGKKNLGKTFSSGGCLPQGNVG